MADALCGPSNPLQNFQKHSQVDRTLQQDRFTSRSPQGQGFRSQSSTPNSFVNAEFEAFQSGGPSQSFAHPLSPQNFHPPTLHQNPSPYIQQQTQHVASSGWASDFQRLKISGPQHPTVFAAQRPPQGDWSAAFQQVQQQAPQQHWNASMASSTPFNSGLQFNPALMSIHNQTAPNQVSMNRPQSHSIESAAFDSAAFEREFQAHDLRVRHEEAQTRAREPESRSEAQIAFDELDKAAIATNIYDMGDSLPYEGQIESGGNYSALADYQMQLELLEQQRIKREKYISEGLWADKMADEIAQTTFVPEEARPDFSRMEPVSEGLVAEMERFENDIEEGRYGRANDHDELARTAGELLDRVSDNTSSKFQNSVFLSLMTRLRDKEVVVDGDKIVDSGTLVPIEEHEGVTTDGPGPSQQPQGHPITRGASRPWPTSVLNQVAVAVSAANQTTTTPPKHWHVPPPDFISCQWSTAATDTAPIPPNEQDTDLGRFRPATTFEVLTSQSSAHRSHDNSDARESRYSHAGHGQYNRGMLGEHGDLADKMEHDAIQAQEYLMDFP